MNKGLSKELSKAFSSNITPVHRPLIQSEVIPDPYITPHPVGFVDADGRLYVKLSKHILVNSPSAFSAENSADVDHNKVKQIGLTFSITQTYRDAYLLNKIVEYLREYKYSQK